MKKTYLTLLLTFILALLLGVIGYAQDGNNDLRKERIEQLRQKLELTDEQIAQWKLIREKYKPQIEALRSEDMDRSDKKAELMKIQDNHDAELQKVMTTNQFQEFKHIRRYRYQIIRRRSYRN